MANFQESYQALFWHCIVHAKDAYDIDIGFNGHFPLAILGYSLCQAQGLRSSLELNACSAA